MLITFCRSSWSWTQIFALYICANFFWHCLLPAASVQTNHVPFKFFLTLTTINLYLTTRYTDGSRLISHLPLCKLFLLVPPWKLIFRLPLCKLILRLPLSKLTKECSSFSWYIGNNQRLPHKSFRLMLVQGLIFCLPLCKLILRLPLCKLILCRPLRKLAIKR